MQPPRGVLVSVSSEISGKTRTLETAEGSEGHREKLGEPLQGSEWG